MSPPTVEVHDPSAAAFTINFNTDISYATVTQFLVTNNLELTDKTVDLSGVEGDKFFYYSDSTGKGQYEELGGSARDVLPDSDLAQYAIVKLKASTAISKDLTNVNLNTKLNELQHYTNDSQNQQFAFKYLFIFLFVVTIINMIIHFNKLNLPCVMSLTIALDKPMTAGSPVQRM